MISFPGFSSQGIYAPRPRVLRNVGLCVICKCMYMCVHIYIYGNPQPPPPPELPTLV